MDELREGNLEKPPPTDGWLACDMVPPRHSFPAPMGMSGHHR